MKKAITGTFLFTTVTLLAGCNLLSTDNEDDTVNKMIQTDQDFYTAKFFSESQEPDGSVNLRFRFEVIATFENTLSDTLYYFHCGENRMGYGTEPIAINSDDPNLNNSFTIFTSACGSQESDERGRINILPPIEVPPGSARIDTLQLTGPSVPSVDQSSIESFAKDFEGTYRLITDGYTCLKDNGNKIDSTCLLEEPNFPRSNTFELKLEEGAIR